RMSDFLLTIGSLATARDGAPERLRYAAAAIPWGPRFVGRSQAIGQLLEDVNGAARAAGRPDGNVLITGESGTGKELIAAAIHAESGFRGGAFVARNCAAIPESLAESEVFGYVPNSGIAGSDPTGKPGWFELASKGT